MSQRVECYAVDVKTEDEGSIFVRLSDGARFTRSTLPPGAMWEADWIGDDYRVNGSGPVIVVVLPNGHEWMPGSRSSNCSRRGQDHGCWCVHGEIPLLTVDKNPEPGRSTCVAGAGSIQSGDWHGFLRNGVLVPV